MPAVNVRARLLSAALVLPAMGGCQPGVDVPAPAASASLTVSPDGAALAAAVRARLATDAKLAGLHLDVEMVAGRLRLRGVAPDTALRARAGALAREAALTGAAAVEVVNEVSVQLRAP